MRERGRAPGCLSPALGAASGAARRSRRAAGVGVRVGVGELLAAHRALAAVDAGSRERGASSPCGRRCAPSRADLRAFDAAFAAVFGVAEPRRRDPLAELGEIARAGAAARRRAVAERDAPGDAGARAEAGPAAWSDDGAAARAATSPSTRDAERAAARRLLARLARARADAAQPPHAADAAARRGARPAGDHARRRCATAASCSSAAGARRRCARGRLVLVLDVSGSMAPYARDAAAVRAGERRGARARRGVRVRDAADADHARARRPRPRPRAARAPPSTSRTGRAARGSARRWPTLNREHGRRIGRGAFVVVLSDGWDRGEPGGAGRGDGAAARARRTALVWLNPLAADPRYEPLTRGMRRGAAARRPPAAGQ